MSDIDAFFEIEKYAHLLLGRLTIEAGLISYQQLLTALEDQRGRPERRLGAILVKRGYITVEQFKKIRQRQKKWLSTIPGEWHWRRFPDTVFKGVLYCGLHNLDGVERKDLLAAKKFCQEYKEKDTRKNLTEVLVEDMAIVTKPKMKEFKNQIVCSSWKCNDCGRVYRLFDYDEESPIPCPVCWTSQLEFHEDKLLKKATRFLRPSESTQTATTKSKRKRPRVPTLKIIDLGIGIPSEPVVYDDDSDDSSNGEITDESEPAALPEVKNEETGAEEVPAPTITAAQLQANGKDNDRSSQASDAAMAALQDEIIERHAGIYKKLAMELQNNRYVHVHLAQIKSSEAKIEFSFYNLLTEAVYFKRCYPLQPSKSLHDSPFEYAIDMKEDIFTIFPGLVKRAGAQFKLQVSLLTAKKGGICRKS